MSAVCTCHLGRSTWCAIHQWNRDHLTVVEKKPTPRVTATAHPPVGRPPGVKRRIKDSCIESYGGHTPGPNDSCARCATPRSKW